jgi:glycosyltransferase involved in cell wall biosynthesis
MRVAWITPYLPAPENTGGRIRMAALARGLAAHELCLFSCISSHDVEEERRRQGPFGPWMAVTTAPQRKARELPWSILPAPIRAMNERIAAIVEQQHARRAFDAVVFEHSYAAAAWPRLLRAAFVLDEHNIESSYAAPTRSAGRLTQLRAGIRHAAARSFEHGVWRRATRVVTVNRADAARVGAIRPEGAEVVPNGIALDAYRFVPPSARRGHGILFVGMMSYAPNVRAAVQLAHEVLPRLLASVPDATLTLAGRDPSPEVRALANARVRVTGTLPSVAPLFDVAKGSASAVPFEHAAYAMPVASGAGSSLKVLEPLAAGIPVIAPAFAVRGFDLEPETHYLRAETTDELVAALRRALLAPGELDTMAQRGRVIAEQHAWSALGRRFADIVENAAFDVRRGDPARDQSCRSS